MTSSSLPFTEPDKAIPTVQILPLIAILDGVVLESEAVPPEIEKTKSLTSKLPLPPFVLNTH